MRCGRHKMIVLSVEASDTVEKLRGKIGAWAAGSLLMVDGKVMDCGKTVKDYLPDIQAAGWTLRMAWPKIWVKVQRSSQRGKSEIKVLVKPSTTVASLRRDHAPLRRTCLGCPRAVVPSCPGCRRPRKVATLRGST